MQKIIISLISAAVIIWNELRDKTTEENHKNRKHGKRG